MKKYKASNIEEVFTKVVKNWALLET
jgi:hypothetical protein